MASSTKMERPSATAVRQDPYEELSVLSDSSDQEIKSAYRKLALNSSPATSLPSTRRTVAQDADQRSPATTTKTATYA
ncbi:hypothetical protein ACP70R_001521 [Stipagrostis hirtigluma subsp. patula]